QLTAPFFFFRTQPPTQTSPLSLHDALPISRAASSASQSRSRRRARPASGRVSCSLIERSNLPRVVFMALPLSHPLRQRRAEASRDRKSTRLNSSHVAISYAVFCLKKKTT